MQRYLAADFRAASLRADALAGLTAQRKWMPCKWFYDARGSELFEQITQLPEYYPYRAEREILAARGGEIAAAVRADTLIELGSGSSEKARFLLDPMSRAGTLRRYVPVEVSEAAVLGASQALLADYPELAVHAVVADFTRQMEVLPTGDTTLSVFLGSTLGNLEPPDRAHFLSMLRGICGPRDAVLIGVDLVKDPSHFTGAYDDATGVNGAFNRNMLAVLNRELGADFDLETFNHEALWNPEQEWVEMHLRSDRTQTVKVTELDLAVDFSVGESILTEVSAKFRRSRMEAELAAAGFALRHWWTDRAERYSLSLGVPA
jgi:L-histidine Nalpha-methyltransferase